MDPLFSGTVKQGKFLPDDPVKYQGRLARLEGRRVRVSVGRVQLGRSLPQNKYLWAVVYGTLSEWSGHEPEELHEFCKDKFLASGEQKRLPNGEVMVGPPSTKGLTVEEFSKYVDQVVRWAAEQRVYVPAANEVTA